MAFRPTVVDPDRPHQVRIVLHSVGVPLVTCNCRLRAGVPVIGESPDYPATARLFNEPEVHQEPFGPRDRIRIA